MVLFRRCVMVLAVAAALAAGGAPAGAAGNGIDRSLVATAHGNVEVIAQGSGPLVVMLPSAARGAADLLEVAGLLAAAGYRVLCVEPRGSGRTEGPLRGIELRGLADDLAEVIRAQQAGPAILVGHAAGSFPTRMAAAAHPALVRGVVLAAAGARRTAPELRIAVEKVHDESLTESQRLVYLRQAFFAPGSDASVWLNGWKPLLQFGAGGPPDQKSKDEWWGAGSKPVLELQGENDPFKPAEAAGEYRAEFGQRVSVVVVPRASHAMFPEQPRLVADAILAWAAMLPATTP